MPVGDFYTAMPRRVGKLIQEAVLKFANIHKLKHEDWVNDLPLWLLISENEPTQIRRLQVGVYRTQTDEELRVIPEVYASDTKKRTLTVAEKLLEDCVVCKSLSEITSMEDVMQQLDKAWDKSLMIPLAKNSRTVKISLSA